jgi:hypothetical protein
MWERPFFLFLRCVQGNQSRTTFGKDALLWVDAAIFQAEQGLVKLLTEVHSPVKGARLSVRWADGWLWKNCRRECHGVPILCFNAAGVAHQSGYFELFCGMEPRQSSSVIL